MRVANIRQPNTANTLLNPITNELAIAPTLFPTKQTNKYCCQGKDTQKESIFVLKNEYIKKKSGHHCSTLLIRYPHAIVNVKTSFIAGNLDLDGEFFFIFYFKFNVIF